ncbi:uncharacterized protein LOC109813966 [Cajanus cajan]|uniref:uncharacterized protein LOC109813966 n=1 Tax=Cajanus cajan TaxID=3821 RepID=UPI00098DCD16|nr:uncharacterized protein LOC109813966 [Cajanus cajan]
MAENTRLKELDANVKKILDLMEKRDLCYNERFAQLELALHDVSKQQPGGSNSQTNLPFQVRNIKLDFPKFDGTNVLQWIFKAEQFFGYYSTPELQRLTIVAIHLEKDVVPWFQMMQKNNPFQSWEGFTKALELEFGPSPYECPRSALFKLSQLGSVHDYYVEFTALANRVTGLTVDAILDCFLSGLKLEIRREVLAQSPNSVLKAVSLAKLFEEKYTPNPKPYFSSSYPKTSTTKPQNSPQSKTNALPPLLPTPNLQPFTQPFKPSNVKNITPAEMQIRREKGLCYTCDDKFTPNHRCPNKQYLLLQYEETEEPPDKPHSSEHLTHPNPDPILDHHLSFNALKGSNGVGTMRFQGSIQGVSVQILLDSGSSDNFLQPRLANYLKLPVEPISSFQVMVGNGNSLTVEGLIQELKVSVQGHTLTLPVYLLPVSGADLVLGASWLATLGPHISDYSALTLKFYLNGEFITLHGDNSKLPTPAQFHHIRRMSHTHAIAECYTLQLQFPEVPQDQWADLPADLHPDLARTNPVKVRPYRYPHENSNTYFAKYG